MDCILTLLCNTCTTGTAPLQTAEEHLGVQLQVPEALEDHVLLLRRHLDKL